MDNTTKSIIEMKEWAENEDIIRTTTKIMMSEITEIESIFSNKITIDFEKEYEITIREIKGD